MHLHQWLRQLAQRWSLRDGNRRRRSGRVPSPIRRRVRPRLEMLEERLTPSSLDSLSFTQAQGFGSAVAPNQPSGAITVQLQDPSGHAMTATSNVTVKLSSSSSTGKFLDTSGNALTNNSIVIPTGSSFAFFEYEDSQTGEMTVKGLSTSPFAFGGLDVNVQDRLVFTTSPQSLTPDQVSQPITVQLQDANGTPVAATSDVTINLSGSSTAKFLDTSGNALANNTITIAAGSSSASFKYEDSQAEDTFVNASTTTGTNASQLVDVAYSLAFTTSPQVIASNQMSGPIAIQLQDASGNAVKAASAVTLDVSSTSFSGKLFDLSGNPLPPSSSGFGFKLTVAAGSSSASFQYQDSTTGPATITAQGATSNGGIFGTSVQQQVYVGQPLAITSPGQTIAPGKPSKPMTITLQTAATSGETVLLSSTSSTGQFLDASGNPLSKNADGSYTLPIATGATSANFEYEDSTAGLPTITAETSDLTFATTQQESVGVSVNFTTKPQTVAQGQQSGPITVQLQDSSGKPFTAPSPTGVTLFLNSSSGGEFFDATTGNPIGALTIAGGSSSASFTYENTFTSGTQTVTASLLGVPSLSASQQETVTAPAFTSVAFISPTQTIAAGQASQPITVQLQDNGAAFTATSAVTIKLSSSSSTGKFLDTSGKALTNNSITIAAGSSTASFEYEDSQEWFPSLSATVSGASFSGSQTVNVGGVSLGFATTAQTTATGSPSGTITVQLQDSNGKAVTNKQGFPVSISLTSNSQTGEFLDTTGTKLTSNSITIAAGASSASFEYEDSVGGKPTLTASSFVASSLSATQQETVTGPYKVELVLPLEGALTVNQASKPMVVELLDSTGSSVTVSSAVAVTLSSSSSGGKFLDTSGKALTNNTITIAAGSSTASFEYEDSQVGLPTLTASENGLSSSQLEVVGVKAVFTTSAQTLTTGQISQPVTVQLQDSNGKAVAAPSDLTLNLSGNFSSSTSFLASEEAGVQFLDTSGKPLSTVNGLPALTIAAGASSASFEFSSLLGGTLTVAAGYGLSPFSSSEIPLLLSASQNETVQGLSTLSFTTSQQTLTAGQTSGTVTIQLEDNSGKPDAAPSGGLGVSLSLGSIVSSLSPSTSSPTKFFDANGNPLSANQSGITIITIPEGSSTVSFEFQCTQAGSLSLFASAANGLSASQKETIQTAQPSSVVFVAPSQSLAAGTPSGSITVQLEDKFGNAISAGSGGLTFNLSSSSSTGQFLSASGDFLSSASVTIPQGFSSATFEYEDSQPGTATLTASAGGVSGTQQETIAATSAEIHVTNTNDSGDGSLRAAITAANTTPGSTIVFDPGVSGTIDLQSELPSLVWNTNIIGPGANVLTIERSSSAASTFGGLTIGFQNSTFAPPEPIVTISGLTINNFDGTDIQNYGNLTLRQVDVSNTQALAASGEVSPSDLTGLLAQSGVVSSSGSLTVLDSTVADNAHSGIYGSNLTVFNSTITGNTGGGITALGTAYVVSSTISGNTDTNIPEFFSASLNNFAGGITAVEGVTLYDTIVAGNSVLPIGGLNGASNSSDVVGSFTSLGHNLIGQADSSSSGFLNTDLVGTTANPIDPKLGALANNGGPTQTMALQTGSPALGAGSPANAPATDQRGELRPQQGPIDIGAFEVTGASSSSAPVITHNPSSATVKPGQSATFAASANGNPSPTVQWYVSTNGGSSFSVITGATSPTLTINNVTAAMNGNEYRAVFTNSVGSTTTSTATLTVSAGSSQSTGSSSSHTSPTPPVLNVPPLLAFLNSLFGGVETVNANGTETITDSIFGITLFVSTFNSSGQLVSVTIFGIDITFLFSLL